MNNKKKAEETELITSDCNNNITIDNSNYYTNLTVNAVNENHTLIVSSGTSFCYSTFMDMPNEDELTIDISKRLVKIYDSFTKEISTYNLKKIKSITDNNDEQTIIVAERNLLPGELSKIKEFLEDEIFLEFEDDKKDRYGYEYVFKLLSYVNVVDSLLVQRVNTTLLTNEIVGVQPLNAPTGNLFYIDYQYDNNTAPINNTVTLNNTLTNNNNYITSSYG